MQNLKNATDTSAALTSPPKQSTPSLADTDIDKVRWYSRRSVTGSLLFNFGAFLLPAIYGTLSKLWIANIDSTLVATTDAYTYIGTVAEVINEGLPRASYLIIGNSARSVDNRVRDTATLIAFQAGFGVLLSVAILAAAPQFTAAFVPVDVAATSVNYVRISAFSALFSTVTTAVSAGARALDQPDVPLTISLISVTVNITLDLVFLSTFRPSRIQPSIEIQAGVRLACDGSGAIAGLLYLLYLMRRRKTQTVRPGWTSLKPLLKAGVFFFVESAVRNALYLWQTSGIVALSSDYATAWGVFNTIRWGLIMVPINTLQATSVVHVGHRYGVWNFANKDRLASWMDLWYMAGPAIYATIAGLAIETVLCLILTFKLIEPFAYYLSNSQSVSDLTAYIWRSIDGCYVVGYTTSTLLTGILVATRPILYLVSSLLSNILYVLPWTIALQVIDERPENQWSYYAYLFGGSLVFSLLTAAITLGIWTYRLMHKVKIGYLDKAV